MEKGTGNLYSLHAVIYGRVQGVFFRDFVAGHAQRLNLTGYVRNLPDGTVEVRAEGLKHHLEELLGYLKIGPPSARVREVKTVWSGHTGRYSDFSVKY